MTDRREGTFCPEHDMPWMQCPCPDRRSTVRVQQVVVCTKCSRHCSRCECAEPEMEVRGAA